MLNFGRLVMNIEDIYINRMVDYVNGKLSYEEFEKLESFRIVMFKLKNLARKRAVIELKLSLEYIKKKIKNNKEVV